MAAMVLAASSCKKAPAPYEPQSGEEVAFDLRDAGSAIGSKASYAGTADAGVEYIKWEPGDMVRIFCAECSEPTSGTYGNADHWADYIVGARNAGDNGADIHLNPGTVGLRWGDIEKAHSFYGMFPSPTLTGKDDDSFCAGSTKLKGTIRQTQGIQGDLVTTTPGTGKTMVEALPDMKDMYMVGKKSITPSSDMTEKKVLLEYTPLTTAIQFTITKDTDLTEDVQWVAIESASHPLYGIFTTDLSSTWTSPGEGYTKTYPTCNLEGTKPEEASRLTIDFTGKGVQISKDKALRFTFLLLPLSGSGNVVDDLTFIIKKGSDETSGILKTEIRRTGGATPEDNKVKFPTHKKNYITGLLVPDKVQWTISFDPKVTPWDNNKGGEADAEQIDPLTFTTALEEWTDEEGSTITMED